ncbi:tetratricopeptide repeat-like superfamily protein [Tanacetum coccineum]
MMMGKEKEEIKWGYWVNSSSSECISKINSYFKEVLSYGRHRNVIMEAVGLDPNSVLANSLAAHFCSDNTRTPSLLHAAKSNLECASPYEKAVYETITCLLSPNRDDDLAIQLHSKECASPYEKAVYETITCLLSPNRDDDLAIQLHSKLLKEFPKDLVSLKRAQVLAFYMGRPDLSLQLVQQVLPSNDQQDFVYGMLAFPLLELGNMEDAEKAAKKGFEINKEDPWSQHALCHVFQYQCRFKEAVEFMEQCSNSWAPLSSFMNTHNWWHVALCYLEGNAPFEKVREIYDNRIWKELDRSDATPVEVYLNAVGLLLRVHVRGKIHIFEDHLKILSGYLSDRSFWYLEWHLDLLILWALACTGKSSAAQELLNGLKSKVTSMNSKKGKIMQKGLVLAEAAYEYGRGDFTRALELLGPDFDANNCKVLANSLLWELFGWGTYFDQQERCEEQMVGASGEQLDVFNEVCYMKLDSGNGVASAAIEVIENQLKMRDGTPFLWRLLERGYSTLGKQEAESMGAKAKALENAYF